MQIVGRDADVETSFGENASFVRTEDCMRGSGELLTTTVIYNIIRVVEERKNREWISPHYFIYTLMLDRSPQCPGHENHP